MNIAILFDSAEEDTQKNHPKLCEREVYLHALEQFYIHKRIDHIFFLYRYDDSVSPELEELRGWRTECGREIPLTVLHGIDNIAKIWLHILQQNQEKPGLYVFHDVRYPMVTQEMISNVIQTAEKENVVLSADRSGRVGYPAAVWAGSHILHGLNEPRKVLQELTYCAHGVAVIDMDLFPVYDVMDVRRMESLLMKAG